MSPVKQTIGEVVQGCQLSLFELLLKRTAEYRTPNSSVYSPDGKQMERAIMQFCCVLRLIAREQLQNVAVEPRFTELESPTSHVIGKCWCGQSVWVEERCQDETLPCKCPPSMRKLHIV